MSLQATDDERKLPIKLRVLPISCQTRFVPQRSGSWLVSVLIQQSTRSTQQIPLSQPPSLDVPTVQQSSMWHSRHSSDGDFIIVVSEPKL